MAIKSVQELYDDFITELQSQSPDLTDTTEGSKIDILAGVVSNAVDEINRVSLDEFKKTFFDTADGNDLETLAIDHFGTTFARPQAVKSTGTVTFTRPNTSAGNVTILAGSVVKTATNAAGKSQRYELTTTVTLTGLTINASVRALVAGTDGNVNANTVNIIETTLTDSTVTVNNITSFTGGDDAQDDSEYRETIRNLIQTLTGATARAIKAKALTIAGVELAACIESLQYVKEWDIGSSSPVGDYFAIPRATLYISDANGTASLTLINDVKTAIESARAAGVFVDVVGAVPITIDWSASLSLNPSGSNYLTLLTDTSLIKDEMTKYIQDLEIGTSFNKSLARSYILNIFGASGTNDLTDFVISVPSGNVTLDANEKAIVGVISTE